MNVTLPQPMTVEQFLRWSQRQETGRYELEGGRVVAMPAETFGHVEIKDLANIALKAAVARSGAPYFVLPDGMSVRIAADRCYEPDVIIAPLPRPARDALEVENPIIVVEVLSPTPASMRRDLTTKLEGYARVPSIEHYIVIDPAERVVLHYRRQGAVLLPPEKPVEGALRLDPPGIEVALADLLGPEPAAPPAA